jgi:early secretory antigenic target protein ESAT-6
MSEMGTDDLILVTYGTVDKAAADTRTTATFMNDQLGRLRDDLRQLKQLWEGPGATEYRTLQGKWDTAAADLNQILSQLPQMLEDIRQYYDDWEKKVAGMWNGGGASG